MADPSDNIRFRGLVVALCALVVLAVGIIAGTLLMSADHYATISSERERTQTANALSLKLRRMRNDLTSVTFWDDAVENTAVRFDADWADENIGKWLHSFYDADQAIVLGEDNQPLYASAGGVSVPVSAYGDIAPQVTPLLAGVRQRASAYRPGQMVRPSAEHGLTRGFDAAAFAMIGGRPSFVVVAPILPDFGHVSIDTRHMTLLVSVYNVDASFLQTLSDSVLVAPVTLGSWSTGASNRDLLSLPLANAAGEPIAALSWQPQRHFSDLLRLLGPFALTALLVMTAAGILVTVYLRRTSRELYASRHEAAHDELTGLANRRRLSAGLAASLSRSAPVGLLFADLDRFKEINDVWGHEAGDTVLRATARRIAAAFPNDLCARIGGDEFVVLLSDADRSEVRRGAKRLLDVLSDPHDIGGNEIALAGSVGMALSPEHGSTAEELLRRADLALNEAKRRGRGRVLVFEREFEQDVQDRRQMEAELRHALDGNEGIHVLYQPLVAAGSSEILGVEALARWRRADGREVPPSVFVPVAEEAGLIGALGRHMLQTACRDALRWGDLPVSVNLSPLQFRNEDIIDDIRTVLTETRLAPARLRLEVTESVLIHNPEAARRLLERLRDIGVKLALDDFGTGYSSLAYLRRFKFDCLKLDQSFLEGLDPDTEAMTVIGSMVALGHALGLSVVAEGVETQHQVDMLKRAGCDQMQGNLFGAPMTRGALESALGRRDSIVQFPTPLRPVQRS